MDVRSNPFHELYVTESIGSEKFVHLFSPFLVDEAMALFQPGHVILKGLQGSGKSMLLSLLKPSIRVAYAKHNAEFPVPAKFGRFVGAGINLIRSGVSDFGQRSLPNDPDFENSPFLFADYLNYWIIYDILKSIHDLSNPSCDLSHDIGLNPSQDRFEEFAMELKNEDCWFGYMQNVNSYAEFKDRLKDRIRTYRAFLNTNLSEIPPEILKTKTIVGEPMLSLAKLLRKHGIVSNSTEIFVRIDQYEELTHLEECFQNRLAYQEIIHKLLYMRNDAVSYRVGTRHFAWKDGAKVFGTSARLEQSRNYVELSLDTLLRRKENSRTWIFPDFAQDIFNRRVRVAELKYSGGDSLVSAFGNSAKPVDKAKEYVKSNRSNVVEIDAGWPVKWSNFLTELAQEDPLAARFAEAWSRQKAVEKKNIVNNVPENRPFPWDKKQWWKKERTAQALLQIASRNNQHISWYGKEDIVSLSGSNILAFLSICRHIWAVWIRDNKDGPVDRMLPIFDKEIQRVGINEASDEWFDKITELKGGRKRKLLVQHLGTAFYDALVNDKPMSYPGRNGFSVSIEELEKNNAVYEFLKDASDFGDLYDAPHTSKHKTKKRRWKWYLNPILSPHFKIPETHTKEPLYVSVKTVTDWMNVALEKDVPKSNWLKKGKSADDGQMKFGFEPDTEEE